MSKLIPKTFKITPYQKMMLKTSPFSDGNAGIMIRILLDDLFDGKLPLQMKKFRELIARRSLEQQSQALATPANGQEASQR